MRAFLFIAGAVLLLAGGSVLLTALEVDSLAKTSIHQIYAALIAVSGILLLGFGLVLLGVSSIIRQNDAARQSPPRTNTTETGAASKPKQAQNINNDKDDDAESLFWYPLHRAAEQGHIDTANNLIKAGTDVNTKTNSGKTPLHIAAKADKTDMAMALIKAGADLRIRSNDNQTPLQIAEHCGNEKTAKLLRDAEKGNTP